MGSVEIAKKVIGFGSKRIHLPKFTIALMRTPGLSPYHARFEVPLNFSKFDIKDYLYHAYNVKCFNIRSYVKLQPVRDTFAQPRHMFRPDSKKYMTVEMERPFVWPADPEDWEPWGREDQEKREKEAMEQFNPSHGRRREAMEKLKVQAEEILRKRKLSLASWTKARPEKLVQANEPKYKLKV
ncbi:hypothetical protein K505DRAFT_277675 [Melanomma pulvis-pyrius CBS 109.77]|uniref:Large ribosomal subunit protein uL23m n=1 Tax=Melanomma pulvis-pyrius CBS 109.77 TaxID=1314802 RepID=A0A6A6X9L0_9PLEO|nr:hypothetical protein K505DRAFT_277675 [Melanomma pulvis-pyrius CBS 109.77]